MDTLQEIQLIDLLCRREAELVKVAQAEEAIRNLLGGAAFAFPSPPELPSLRKPQPRSAASRTGVAMADRGLPGLRRLQAPDENAYRLVYRFHGEEKESFQAEADFVRLLLNFPGEAFQLLKIETVFFRSCNDWQTGELLWQAGASFRPDGNEEAQVGGNSG